MLQPSELIRNADGSIYHLNLLPGDIAPTIISVGDPDRVPTVSRHFDTITLKKGKREFVTHTGTYKGKTLSVISTGIGTDNVDIVLNELDALVNIDFSTGLPRDKHTQLDIVRIGTTGAVQHHIPVDSFLIGESAIGMDGLLHFYEEGGLLDTELQQAFESHMKLLGDSKIKPYAINADPGLLATWNPDILRGITVTNAGFYAPQGRQLRLVPKIKNFHAGLRSFRYKNKAISNLEMETAGIYGLSKLLGHRALSLNVVLANRPNGEFSNQPQKSMDALIEDSLYQLLQV